MSHLGNQTEKILARIVFVLNKDKGGTLLPIMTLQGIEAWRIKKRQGKINRKPLDHRG